MRCRDGRGRLGHQRDDRRVVQGKHHEVFEVDRCIGGRPAIVGVVSRRSDVEVLEAGKARTRDAVVRAEQRHVERRDRVVARPGGQSVRDVTQVVAQRAARLVGDGCCIAAGILGIGDVVPEVPAAGLIELPARRDSGQRPA